MGRPYSLDLLERVVAAVEKGGLSCNRAAAQFGLGISTVINWGCGGCARPAALPPARWVATSQKRFPVSIASGFCSGSGRRTSQYVGWLPSLPSGALRSIIARSGTSSMPRS